MHPSPADWAAAESEPTATMSTASKGLPSQHTQAKSEMYCRHRYFLDLFALRRPAGGPWDPHVATAARLAAPTLEKEAAAAKVPAVVKETNGSAAALLGDAAEEGNQQSPDATDALLVYNRRGRIQTPDPDAADGGGAEKEAARHGGDTHHGRQQQQAAAAPSPPPHTQRPTTNFSPSTARGPSPAGSGAFLQWDSKRSGMCSFCDNGTTAVADRSQLSSSSSHRGHYAIGTIGIAKGEFVFELLVDRSALSFGHFAVGVASKYFRGPTGRKCPAYLYRSDGCIMAASDDTHAVKYSGPMPKDTRVTVHLDMNRWELSFYVNGSFQGVAFRFTPLRDPEPLFPVVVFSGEGDSATLMPPSADALPEHVSPTRHGLSPVVKVREAPYPQ